MTRGVLLRVLLGLVLFGAALVGSAAIADALTHNGAELRFPHDVNPSAASEVFHGGDGSKADIDRARALLRSPAGAAESSTSTTSSTLPDRPPTGPFRTVHASPADSFVLARGATGTGPAGTTHAGATTTSTGPATGFIPSPDPEGDAEHARAEGFRFLDLSDLDLHLFIDPCAGETPGAGSGADCPETGTGATLLDIGFPTPPYDIMATWYDLDGWGRANCSPQVLDGVSQVGLVVNASHPSKLDITYFPDEHPDQRRTVTVDDRSGDAFTTWVDQVAQWNAGERHSVDLVKNCAVIDGIPRDPGAMYTLEIHGESVSGETDTSTVHAYLGAFPHRAPGPRPRPPISIRPTAVVEHVVPGYLGPTPSTQVNVTVPFIHDGSAAQSVRMAVLSGTDAAMPGGCTGQSARRTYSGDDFQIVGDPTVSEIPRSERSADEYPYDPRYSHTTSQIVTLKEGSTYRFCLWWERPGVHSYDPNRVDDHESRVVTTPDLKRVRVSIESADFPYGADPHQFGIHTVGGEWYCSTSFPDASVEPGGSIGASAPFCDSNGWPLFSTTTFQIRGRDADSEVEVSTPPQTTAVESTINHFNLPEAESHCDEHRGSPGFNEGVLYRCGTMGTLRLRFEYYDGSRSGVHELSVGGPQTFPLAEHEPPVNPQIDGNTMLVRPEIDPASPLTPRLSVDMRFDRPVTGRIVLDGDCHTGDSPTELPIADPTTHFSGTFPNLCRGDHYGLGWEISDADGHTNSYGIALGGAAFPVDIPPVRVSFSGSIRVTDVTPRRGCLRGSVLIGIHDWDFAHVVEDGTDLTPPTLNAGIGGYYGRPLEWYDPVPVEVGLSGAETCTGEGQSISVSGTVQARLADLLSGAPDVLTFTGDGVTIAVTVEAHATEEAIPSPGP